MKKTRIFLITILSILSAIIPMIAGAFINVKWPGNTVLIIVLSVLSVLPLLLLLLQVILAKRFFNKFKQMKVAEGNAFLVSHRNDAEKTAKEKLKELQHIRHFTAAYAVFVAFLAIAIAMLGGVLIMIVPPLSTICFVYSVLVFFSVYTRIRGKRRVELNDDAVVLSQNDYPLIHSLARKAADCVGCKDEIVILPMWNCSASILKDHNRSLLQIGVVLLNILSEQELYAILLHEFAHVSDDNRAKFREEQYNIWLCEESGGNNGLSAFLSNLYLYFAARYNFNFLIYQYACSVVNELQADKAMAEHGDAKIAVSALLKTHYDNMFFWESGVKNEASIYESEELKADYLTYRISLFKDAIAMRSSYWNELVSKEILANNASHPTLKMRMDALGIDELKLIDAKSSDEYLAEVEKLLDFSENYIYEERKKTYEKERKEQYLEPLARIEAWQKAGEPITPEGYADLVTDLKILCRHEQAEALCDRAIEQLPAMSAAHATFMKGSTMLFRYDERGMDLIYRAMELNGNYVEEGLHTIGSFCCLTGREEDLLEYRKKAALLAQKHMDEDEQISFLSKSDNLTKENLPDGMLEEILAYIKSIDQDIIENIYLVRKTVSETFFASVFIIHFYGGTDAQRNDIMHKIFRFLDSHPTEWQFSLFDYHQYPEVKVEKIEGSLVYSKKDSKGD